MNSYINKLLRVYIEQRNYLSGQISLSRVDPGHAALTRSALFVKVLKCVSILLIIFLRTPETHSQVKVYIV